jgi:hypothetical protein
MLNRTMVRNACGAAAILIGLTAQASAQTSQPPAGVADQNGYYNGWNDYYDNDRGYYRDSYAYRPAPYYGGGYYRQSYYGDGSNGNGYDGNGYYGDRYYGGPVEAGLGVAGAVVGGAVGTVGAAVGGPYYAQQGADDSYCASRYRSFDPASGTYLGFDGRRHQCR